MFRCRDMVLNARVQLNFTVEQRTTIRNQLIRRWCVRNELEDGVPLHRHLNEQFATARLDLPGCTTPASTKICAYELNKHAKKVDAAVAKATSMATVVLHAVTGTETELVTEALAVLHAATDSSPSKPAIVPGVSAKTVEVQEQAYKRLKTTAAKWRLHLQQLRRRNASLPKADKRLWIAHQVTQRTLAVKKITKRQRFV